LDPNRAIREGLMGSKTFSVLGIFDSAELMMQAIPQVKAQTKLPLEAYTPYPVEGLAEILGLRKSPIAGMVLVLGIIGAIAAISLQLWTSGFDYPLTTAGKPHLSWEAFIPIVFEVTVLFATFTAGLGMLLLLNRLPMFRNPMLRAKSMPLITRDKFALAVESRGRELDVDEISKMFRRAGARQIEAIEELPPIGLASPNFFFAAFAAIAISCFAAGLLTYWAMKLFPVLPPMSHMLNQPRVKPQQDSSAMRMPVAGTVARDSVPYTVRIQEDAAGLVNPYPRNDETLNRGRQAFNNYCAVCHGLLGNGSPTLTAAYGAKPANFVSQKFVDMRDGEIYHVLRMGKNAMPSYSADLAENERWAAIHYIRALQRAMNAKDDDLK
jgi:mono/diheme cytochrome c family protein